MRLPRRRPTIPPLLALTVALRVSQPGLLLAQTPPPTASASPAATGSASPDTDPTAIARARFSEALALARKDRWKEAYPLFLEAWQNKQHWQIALNLGQAEIKVEKFRDAVEHLTFVEAAPDTPEADRREAAKLKSAAQARLAHLRIEASPHGARVLVNGQLVGKAPLAHPIDVDPGLNTVEVRLGATLAEESVVAKSGETITMTLALPLSDIESPPQPAARPSAAAPAAPPPGPGAFVPAQREPAGRNVEIAGDGAPTAAVVAALTLGGLAVAGTAVGTGLFISSSQRAARADAILSDLASDPALTPGCKLDSCVAVDALLQEQDAFENAAVGTWIGSGITGAAAVALWLITRRSSSAVPGDAATALSQSLPSLRIPITGHGGGLVIQGQF